MPYTYRNPGMDSSALDKITNIISPGGVVTLENFEKRLTDILTRAGKKAATETARAKIAFENAERKKQQKEDKEFIKQVYKLEAENTHNPFKKMAATFKAEMVDMGKKIGDSLYKALSNVVNKIGSGIDSYIRDYNKYLSTFSTRLQGTSLNANTIMKNISTNLNISPYLKQETMLENVNKLVQSGVAYNLELRAYVATATEKIANTFNAFDSSLLRLIRIQQADSTVARLGMESLLTKFLNTQYKDTSYLSNIGTANITSQLLEAESLMGYRGASEFDYAVQRWLGSMSALGVSSNTITSLAQGLGYLGSGNISALSGNQGLQNLLVMATGGQFGNLLTGGLTASSASNILQNIVAFGQQIAGSGNNVVLSQFANLFGLSVSDIVSLTNITTQDVKKITENIVEYEQLRQETSNQLASMSKRTSAAEMVSNVLANMTATMGANVATSPFMLATWLVADLMSSSGLDYTFETAPLGVGLSSTLSQLMKTGVIGASAITSLITAAGASSISNLTGTNISIWEDKETTRGEGLGIGTLGRGPVLSSSSFIGGMSGDVTQAAFEQAQTQAQDYSGSKTQDELMSLLRDKIANDVSGIKTILENWDLRFENSVFRSA